MKWHSGSFNAKPNLNRNEFDNVQYLMKPIKVCRGIFNYIDDPIFSAHILGILQLYFPPILSLIFIIT